MLSFDITIRRQYTGDEEYNGGLETDPSAHQVFATATVPIATIRLLAA